ncbi:hypothetical protein AB4155_03775 [Vibrio splendidus]
MNNQPMTVEKIEELIAKQRRGMTPSTQLKRSELSSKVLNGIDYQHQKDNLDRYELYIKYNIVCRKTRHTEAEKVEFRELIVGALSAPELKKTKKGRTAYQWLMDEKKKNNSQYRDLDDHWDKRCKLSGNLDRDLKHGFELLGEAGGKDALRVQSTVFHDLIYESNNPYLLLVAEGILEQPNAVKTNLERLEDVSLKITNKAALEGLHVFDVLYRDYKSLYSYCQQNLYYYMLNLMIGKDRIYHRLPRNEIEFIIEQYKHIADFKDDFPALFMFLYRGYKKNKPELSRLYKKLKDLPKRKTTATMIYLIRMKNSTLSQLAVSYLFDKHGEHYCIDDIVFVKPGACSYGQRTLRPEKVVKSLKDCFPDSNFEIVAAKFAFHPPASVYDGRKGGGSTPQRHGLRVERIELSPT